jgi:DNA-binding MarR family transcriptional regulator
MPSSEIILKILNAAAAWDLNLTQARIMLLLDTDHPTTPSAIAATIGITPAGASGAITDLMQRGIIRKTKRSKKDRRLASFPLTQYGHLMVEALISGNHSIPEEALKPTTATAQSSIGNLQSPIPP